MLRKPEQWEASWARAEAAEWGARAREKAARATGIGWGIAIGCAVGLAAFAMGWI